MNCWVNLQPPTTPSTLSSFTFKKIGQLTPNDTKLSHFSPNQKPTSKLRPPQNDLHQNLPHAFASAASSSLRLSLSLLPRRTLFQGTICWLSSRDRPELCRITFVGGFASGRRLAEVGFGGGVGLGFQRNLAMCLMTCGEFGGRLAEGLGRRVFECFWGCFMMFRKVFWIFGGPKGSKNTSERSKVWPKMARKPNQNQKHLF